jgi:hypothetical protein
MRTASLLPFRPDSEGGHFERESWTEPVQRSFLGRPLTLESCERIPGVCERSLLRCIESRGLREPSLNCLVRLLNTLR